VKKLSLITVCLSVFAVQYLAVTFAFAFAFAFSFVGQPGGLPVPLPLVIKACR